MWLHCRGAVENELQIIFKWSDCQNYCTVCWVRGLYRMREYDEKDGTNGLSE